jgi:ketosteroid isomerase-like protein
VAVSEKLEMLRRAHEEFNRADLSVLRELVTEDVRWGTTGAFAGLDPFYQGVDAVSGWVEEVRSAWESFEVGVEEVLVDEGALLAVVERFHGRGLESGADVEMRAFAVYEFREGLIAARRAFTDKQAALEASGRP